MVSAVCRAPIIPRTAFGATSILVGSADGVEWAILDRRNLRILGKMAILSYGNLQTRCRDSFVSADDGPSSADEAQSRPCTHQEAGFLVAARPLPYCWSARGMWQCQSHLVCWIPRCSIPPTMFTRRNMGGLCSIRTKLNPGILLFPPRPDMIDRPCFPAFLSTRACGAWFLSARHALYGDGRHTAVNGDCEPYSAFSSLSLSCWVGGDGNVTLPLGMSQQGTLNFTSCTPMRRC